MTLFNLMQSVCIRASKLLQNLIPSNMYAITLFKSLLNLCIIFKTTLDLIVDDCIHDGDVFKNYIS